jgi:hypothetical protein
MSSLGMISPVTLCLMLQSGSAFAQADQQAAEGVKQGVMASGHASASAAHSIIASGQVTSGVAAVPLSMGAVAVGSAAVGSARAANDSAISAAAPIGTPLPVTDDAIVTVPPDVALKKKAAEDKPPADAKPATEKKQK